MKIATSRQDCPAVCRTQPHPTFERLHRFARAEDGSLIIFGIFIFMLMLAIGGLSFDLMRYEANRTRLQATTDRAALAAASLTQSLDPKEVVEDYFLKANMADYLDEVVVTDTFGSRRVDVTASLHVPLHHGNFGVFSSGPDDTDNDTLIVTAQSSAMEAIGNVEISMVLDVSGSMGSYSRLTNLKTASGNFIDAVYGAAETGTVSTSVIPYSEQVTAGSKLLSHYTLDSSKHSNSYCVNFASGDYSSTELSPTTTLQQTLHFDPWTPSNYWSIDQALPSPICHTQSSRRILPWEENPATIKSHINTFYASGNTSTDVGLKWGAALLDPGSRPVLNAMVASGDVTSSMADRPVAFRDGETMKIMVVMSDGENTTQHYLNDPYRSGDTAFYVYRDNGRNYYSVWTGEGAPATDPQPTCKDFDDKKNECKKWNRLEKDWYRVNDKDQSETPYGGSNSSRMTWTQLWAEIPIDEMTDEILPDMGNQSAEITAIKAALKYHNGTTKNARMASICSAAKSAGITIFSVALDTNNSAAARLESCASSPAHFYRVSGSGIDFAFQSIASQINQLRLVH